MANSYTSLLIDNIFSTHKRAPVLASAVHDRLWACMGGIARENKLKAISIGGTLDHAHMLISIPPMIPVAKVVQLVKGGSSKWLHENFSSLRKFFWQERDMVPPALGHRRWMRWQSILRIRKNI